MNKIIKNVSAVKNEYLTIGLIQSSFIISITGGLYMKQLETFFLLIDQCLNDTKLFASMLSVKKTLPAIGY